MPATPITTANAAAVAEVIRVVDAIDRATDARQWDALRDLFAERVRTDFSSLSGGAPADMTADALVGSWAANLTGAKTSCHLRTNHQVDLTEDRATVRSVAYAWNRMDGGGEPLWEIWGDYEHGLVRTERGWRCDAMTLTVTHQRGNSWVRDTPGNAKA